MALQVILRVHLESRICDWEEGGWSQGVGAWAVAAGGRVLRGCRGWRGWCWWGSGASDSEGGCPPARGWLYRRPSQRGPVPARNAPVTGRERGPWVVVTSPHEA